MPDPAPSDPSLEPEARQASPASDAPGHEGEAHPRAEPIWRGILEGTDPRYRTWRTWLQRVPSRERCNMCAAPFSGPFSPVMRLIGRARWRRNPKYCTMCFKLLEGVRGGAEVECSMLFADVRGSTTLAEQMSATEFRHLLDRFYQAASDVVIDQDGIIDKFVGDEIVAIFIPALAHDAHAARAMAAARELLRRTGHGGPGEPWLPIGAGIATGIAFVGAVGSADHVEFTALGDVVNTAARLASAAGAGEILVTLPALERSSLPPDGLERRSLDLKGKALQVDVAVLPRV